MHPASAEETALPDEVRSSLEALQEAAGTESGFDAASFIQLLLSGEMAFDMDSLPGLLSRMRTAAWREFAALAGSLAMPMGLMLLMKLLFGSSGGALRAPDLLCRLCVMAVMTVRFAEARKTALDLTGTLASACGALSPVLTAMAALGGAPSVAGALTPLSAALADVLQGWLRGWGIDLCAIAAAIALIGSLSPDYPLKGAFELVKRAQHWLLGGTLFAFTGLLTAQGIMGRAKDGIAMRAAKSAVESAIPIIGGELSDVTGVLTGSAAAIRGALGLTGLAVLAHLCLEPILRLLANMLSIKLAAAVFEPVAVGAASELLDRFSAAHEMLLAACATCSALAFMLFGSCLLFAGSMPG